MHLLDGRRHLSLFHQMDQKGADLRFAHLIRGLFEVPDEIGDAANIFCAGLLAVAPDLEILFHLVTQFSHLDSPY